MQTGSKKMQGEGNYDAAREFDKDQTNFAKDDKRVRAGAEEAKRAVDNPSERDELEAAERKGRKSEHHDDFGEAQQGERQGKLRPSQRPPSNR